MKSVFVTGSGMLASAVARAAPAFGFEPVTFSRTRLDITDRSATLKLLAAGHPDLILHTAALTRVNHCELHPELALAVNRDGTAHVVEAAEQAGAHLVYFSTDYVFDGSRERPWLEDDQPQPLNVYGRSKLAGEACVLAYRRGHVIRTSGIFGPRNDGQPERNFVRAITEKLVYGSSGIPVVTGQRTALTYAPHLAAMVFSLLEQDLPEIIHLTSHGSDSWYGWARRVCLAASEPEARILAVDSASLDDRTPRPAYSVLASNNPAAAAQMQLHPVLPALSYYVNELVNMYRVQGHE